MAALHGLSDLFFEWSQRGFVFLNFTSLECNVRVVKQILTRGNETRASWSFLWKEMIPIKCECQNQVALPAAGMQGEEGSGHCVCFQSCKRLSSLSLLAGAMCASARRICLPYPKPDITETQLYLQWTSCRQRPEEHDTTLSGETCVKGSWRTDCTALPAHGSHQQSPCGISVG